MAYPMKYIENNLVFNHDGECFAYYELISLNALHRGNHRTTFGGIETGRHLLFINRICKKPGEM